MVRRPSISPSVRIGHRLDDLPLAWAGLLAAMLLAALWARALWQTYRAWGLFQHGLGDDFANYYAQSRVLWSGDPGAIYRLDALQGVVSQLAPYATSASEPPSASAVPYPPLFAWLFTPFTAPAPPLGFALWTALNLGGLGYLAWRITRGKSTLARWACVALFCTSWPLVFQFSLGQPIVLLACVVSECYDALSSGHDTSAGLWMSLLIFRPQYGLLLGALLLWKRRWNAVIAAAAGVLLIVLASLAVSSLPTLLEYPHAIQDEGGFHGTPGNPVEFMINWRSLVVLAAPAISDAQGLLLTLALGMATVFAAAWAWRGPWQPRGARFGAQMTVLLLATLVANYHSHVYGAVLLVVPLMAALEGPYVNRAARFLIVGAVLLPSLLAAAGYQARANHVLTILLIAILVSMLADLRSDRARHWEPGTPLALSAASFASFDR
jgi:hypothetical protein